MQEELDRLAVQALAQLQACTTLDELAKTRSAVLGKKGSLGEVLRQVGALPAAERPRLGQLVNQHKARLAEAADAVALRIKQQQDAQRLAAGRCDLSRPGRRMRAGTLHPLTVIEKRCVRCLERLGFTVADGPHVEHDWYNFAALNIPPEHPARDMQDTFFIAPEVVLRTHTSNVQIRAMGKQPPPIRIVAPGMVFRKDDVDATHSPVFHQLEGLWIDETATFASLKGVLEQLALDLFGADAAVRFRPSYFPFTEPSAEMDVRWGGKWMEIMGAGMVHPAVLRAVGYDPDVVQGFAFGMGLERIAMAMWGIDDIRLFYDNDMRFLAQFAAESLAVM